jgi:hypothetical protein
VVGLDKEQPKIDLEEIAEAQKIVNISTEMDEKEEKVAVDIEHTGFIKEQSNPEVKERDIQDRSFDAPTERPIVAMTPIETTAEFQKELSGGPKGRLGDMEQEEVEP